VRVRCDGESRGGGGLVRLCFGLIERREQGSGAGREGAPGAATWRGARGDEATAGSPSRWMTGGSGVAGRTDDRWAGGWRAETEDCGAGLFPSTPDF
jgi:hypothetical protein